MVYRTEVEKLAAAERNFAETMPPIEALRAWMLLFVNYIATKKIISAALNTSVGDPKRVFGASYNQVWEAMGAVVKLPSRAVTYAKISTLSISFAL